MPTIRLVQVCSPTPNPHPQGIEETQATRRRVVSCTLLSISTYMVYIFMQLVALILTYMALKSTPADAQVRLVRGRRPRTN